MCITVLSAFLPHEDPDASLAFDRDTLGFEVRKTMTGPSSQELQTVLHPVSDLTTAKEALRNG